MCKSYLLLFQIWYHPYLQLDSARISFSRIFHDFTQSSLPISDCFPKLPTMKCTVLGVYSSNSYLPLDLGH